MSDDPILRATDFKELADVQPDSKNRIVLKRVRKAQKSYRIYENSLGQIILDPMVAIPASEAWLFENPKALAAVRKGLKESAEGRVVKRPGLARHAEEELE